MTSAVPEEVEITHELDEQGNPREAHRIKRTVSGDAYVFGMEVEALCGYVFVPTRPVEKFPLCQKCDAIWKGLPLPPE